MNKKYVDVDEMKARIHCDDPEMRDYKTLMTFIDNLPEADVAPVVHAHWIKHDYAEEFCETIIPNYECSHCHQWFRDDRDYCGECGAKMDERMEKNKDDN